MKRVILEVGYRYVAFDVSGSGLEAVASATLVDKNKDIYVEQNEELTIRLVPSASVVSVTKASEGRIVEHLQREQERMSSKIRNLKLQLAKEKKFWEDRNKAHALGLTDQEWRKQVDAVEYEFNLAKLPRKQR